MNIKEKLTNLSERAEKLTDQIKTEEATKQSLILPFFQFLGYDVFNPLEFCPEFDADYGVKKGEKVDYAIIIDGEPLILIEAKCISENLDKHGSQLFRYFSTTKAKFGVLTNGIKYRFFTDLEENNKMDQRPFFEIDILNLNDYQIKYLENFKKDKLDVESILDTASELKYTSLIKEFLKNELNSTSDDFTNYILSHIYEGRKTSQIVEKFNPIINKAFNQFINETMSLKFEQTLNGSSSIRTNTNIIDESMDDTACTVTIEEPISKILTTAEELEGFAIIKSLLRKVVSPDVITYKDTESYFGILYSNNTRKWICRLQLNSKKYLIIPNEDKTVEKIKIESIDDIYNYEDKLVNVINRFI